MKSFLDACGTTGSGWVCGCEPVGLREPFRNAPAPSLYRLDSGGARRGAAVPGRCSHR